MIRFACPTCKSVLHSPDQTAGGKVACPQCGQRLLIPGRAKPGSELAARFVSLMLALAMLGFLGWLIWMFPNLSLRHMDDLRGTINRWQAWPQ